MCAQSLCSAPIEAEGAAYLCLYRCKAKGVGAHTVDWRVGDRLATARLHIQRGPTKSDCTDRPMGPCSS